MSLVWENIVDNEYPVDVVRTEMDPGYSAELRIWSADRTKILKSWPVTLSYGAKFGPDALDVTDWCVRVVKWIDSREAS